MPPSTFFAETAGYSEAERLLRRARAWTRRNRSPAFDVQYLNARAELALGRHQVGRALRTYRALAERAALIHGRGSPVVLNIRRNIADLTWSKEGARAAFDELAATLSDCESPPGDPEPVVAHAAQAMLAYEMGAHVGFLGARKLCR